MMKTRIWNLFLIAVMIFSLTGCSLWTVEERLDAVEDKLERQLDKAEDAVENALRRNDPDSQGALTQDEAASIALAHAGFSADEVSQLSAGFDMDDGVPQIDVRFREGRWEYTYEIHAETGAILSAERDD